MNKENREDTWIRVENQNCVNKIFSFLHSNFRTWKEVAKFLKCNEGTLHNYVEGSAIPKKIFTKITNLIPFPVTYQELPYNWRQVLGVKRRNELYGTQLDLEDRSKGLENHKITQKERIIINQNETINLPYNFRVHYSIIRENKLANFDLAYFQNDNLLLVEDIEGSFSRNTKLNWFKVWRFIKKKKLVSVPMIVTWFPSYAFTPLMRLILIDDGILPIQYDERSDILLDYFKSFKKLLKKKKAQCTEDLKNLIKFSNAGAKSEIKKPYSYKEPELLNKLKAIGMNIHAKEILEDKFGYLHVVDGMVEKEGKKYLVEMSNKNSVIDVLRRGIGFCFMVENLFQEDYGKIIVFDSKDSKKITSLKLYKTLSNFKNTLIIDTRNMASVA